MLHTETCINKAHYLLRAGPKDSEVEKVVQVGILEHLCIDCADVELVT